jgi:hypothetical protein
LENGGLGTIANAAVRFGKFSAFQHFVSFNVFSECLGLQFTIFSSDVTPLFLDDIVYWELA